jgi:hypothetical protein
MTLQPSGYSVALFGAVRPAGVMFSVNGSG